MINNSTSSNNNHNNNATFEEMVPYDSHFVEMLKNLDPSEVTEEFLQAANTALLEQEKHRKKWAKQQKHYHHQAAQYSVTHNNLSDTNNTNNNINQEDMLHHHQHHSNPEQSSVFLSDNTDDFDDNKDLSSSSSSSSSSSDDDDTDTNGKKDQENMNNNNRNNGDVATAFAQSFLAPDGAVEHFVRDVRDTAHTLQSLRSTIRRFAKKIDGVTSEVGLLQKKARQTDISLINNHNVKQFTSAASELLVPSLDMVRILANQFSPANTGHSSNFTTLNASNDASAFKTSSELPELGRQYLHSVRMLEKMIQARQSHEINVLQTIIVESTNNANSSSSSSSSRKIHEFVAIPFSEFPNLDLPSHRVIEALARQTCLQVRNFLVPRVAAVLGKPRTNIAMQQRSALMPYRTLVGFLRTCATSPDLLPTKSRFRNYHFDSSTNSVVVVDPHLDSSSTTTTATTTLVSPAEAASAFYEELRATYTHFASRVYSTNFTTYIAECLSLQQKTNGNIGSNNGVNNNGNISTSQGSGNVVLPSKTTTANQSQGNSAGNNNNHSSWLDTATSWFSSTSTASPSTNNYASSSSSSSSPSPNATLGNYSNNHTLSTTISSSFSFPSLADPSQTLLPTEFSKRIHSLLASLTTSPTSPKPSSPSSSSSQLLNLHKICSAHPVLPIVQRQQGKFHSPFETFRSVHMLLCDVVTSEFLFTFEFFDGDTNVYDRVFKPVVDTMIQFVMQHFIPSAPPIFLNSSSNNNNNNKQLQMLVMREKSSISSTDVVGLSILTMMAITFRSQMHLRGLHCLDEYFSDVLTLLLPCTKRALEAQYSVIRDELLLCLSVSSSNNNNNLGCNSNCGGMELLAKNCAVSPQQLSVILMKNNNNNNNISSLRQNPASEQLRISLLNKLHPICDRFAHLSFSLRILFIRMSMEYFISEDDGNKEAEDNNHNGENLASKNLKSRSNAKKLSALNGILNSTLGGKNNNSHNKNNENGDLFGNNEENNDDDSDNESIAAMCVTFKAMSLDFLEWIKKFARDEICCGKNYSSFLNLPQQSQQISGTNLNNSNNNNIPIPSAFVINNLGNIFKIWHDLGFGAKINSFLQNSKNSLDRDGDEPTKEKTENDDFANFQQQDRVMDENSENSAGTNLGNGDENSSSCCPLRETIGEIDEEFHNEYESALDEFSYELLKCFMGNVISAIQDAEMTILEIVRSHEEYESDDDEDEGENKNVEKTNSQQKAMIISSVPQQLEEVCVWFRENSADVIVSVSQFCKGTINDKISSLPHSSSTSSGRCQFREIQVSPREDALKRVFTQLLLWNTRLHTCLGRIFGLIQATMSYQQHVTATMAQDLKEKNALSVSSNTVLHQDHLAIINTLSASNTSGNNSANPVSISSGTGKHQQKFRSLTVSNIQLTQWIKQQV